jgi:hypothetical protein
MSPLRALAIDFKKRLQYKSRMPARSPCLPTLFLVLWTGVLAAEDSGFEPIFDGHSLRGWLGQDMSFWSVEDDAITGTISPTHLPSINQYLVWQGGLLADFELQLEFRLIDSPANGSVNGGFQFRSRRLPHGDVAGYQVDNNFGQPWKVRLYDEFGRHDLARQGTIAVFEPDGARRVTPLTSNPRADDFRLDEWHAYHLVARGINLSLSINGQLVAEVADMDADSFEPAGILALQLHTGPPMKAQFRNIRLKKLSPARSPTPRETLLAEASLHWHLGERPDAHQPPMHCVGDIHVLNEPEAVTAHPNDRFARLNAGWFNLQRDLNAPRLWNAPGNALTVFAQVRITTGSWEVPVVGKGDRNRHLHFQLAGHPADDEAPARFGFAIRTDRGTFAATVPAASLDFTQWQNLVGRYDGARLQLLCNGQTVADSPAAGNLVPSDEPFVIGAELRDGTPRRTFSGDFREVAVWTRAISDSEARVLAQPR